MITIARLNTLDDAYRGMDILRQHAIPPALSHEGEYFAIRVDEDFASHAQQLFIHHEITISNEMAAGPGYIAGSIFTEDDNT